MLRWTGDLLMLFSTVKMTRAWISGTESEPSQSAVARDGCLITAPRFLISLTALRAILTARLT